MKRFIPILLLLIVVCVIAADRSPYARRIRTFSGAFPGSCIEADFGYTKLSHVPGFCDNSGTYKTFAVGTIPVGFPAGTKIYTALLTQSAAAAPVATVLQNTLGGTVVWARTGAGVYTATLTGVFTVAKTGTLIGSVPHTGAVTRTNLVAESSHTSADVITVITSFQDGTNNLSGEADGILTDTMIRIEVYP